MQIKFLAFLVGIALEAKYMTELLILGDTFL